MAVYQAHIALEYVDVNGDTAVVRFPFAAGDAGVISAYKTLGDGFATVVNACTNAKNVRMSLSVLYEEAHLIVGTTPPVDAEYSSVTDGARLQFGNASGERSSLTVPAPKESDFGSTSNVVDSTNANVAALISYFATNSSNPNNIAYNLYQGGIKVGRRARRRRSSLVP